MINTGGSHCNYIWIWTTLGKTVTHKNIHEERDKDKEEEEGHDAWIYDCFRCPLSICIILVETFYYFFVCFHSQSFFNFQKNKATANKLSQASVETVMKILYSRLKSRTSLALQLQQLGKFMSSVMLSSLNTKFLLLQIKILFHLSQT